MSAENADRRDRVIHALSDATRRLLLKRIADGAGSVAEISDSLPMSAPAISKHLRVLEGCGLITRQRVGRFHRFVVSAAPISEAAQTLAELIPVEHTSRTDEKSPSDDLDVALL